VRFADWLSDRVLARGVEPLLARGTLERPARIGARVSGLLRRLQSGHLQAYVAYALLGLAIVLGWEALRG
jgi:hypothetical protein